MNSGNIMKRVCFAIFSMTFIPVWLHAQDQPLVPVEYALNQLRGLPPPNLLHPTSAAMDAWRGILYVSTNEHQYLGIKEIPNRRTRPSLHISPTPPLPLTLCHVHPRSGLIIAIRADHDVENHHILGIDPLSGRIVADILIGQVKKASFVSHPQANVVFASFGRRHILLLDGTTLEPVDSIDAGMATSGMALDSIHQQLYVTEAEPQKGLSHVVTVSTNTYQITRSFVYAATEPIDRIAVDPDQQRFAVIGEHSIRVCDGFGIPVWDFPIQARIGDIAYSERSKHLLFLDPDASSHLGRAGRVATMYKISLSTLSMDSTASSVDANRVFVYQPTNEAVTISPATSTVEITFVPDGMRRHLFSLGHSVEDIAITGNGRSVLLTNAAGSSSSFSTLDLESHTLREINADVLSMRFARQEKRQLIILGSSASVDFWLLNSIDGEPSDHLSFSSIPGIIGKAIPTFDINQNGTLFALFPETETFLLVDLASRAISRSSKLEGYQPPATGEDTAVPACFTRKGDRIAILNHSNRTLDVYSPVSPGIMKRLSLERIDWSRVPLMNSLRLKKGLSDDGIWLGPYSIDLVTETIDSIPAEGRIEFLGQDSVGRVFALQQDSSDVTLLASSDERFTDISHYSLLDTPAGPDAVSFDGDQKILALGYSAEGVLRVYRLGSLTSFYQIATKPVQDVPTLFPSIVSPYKSQQLTLHGLTCPSSCLGRSSGASIIDILGRLMYQGPLRTAHQQNHSIMIDLPPMSPGIFLLSIQIGETSYHFRLIVAS